MRAPTCAAPCVPFHSSSLALIVVHAPHSVLPLPCTRLGDVRPSRWHLGRHGAPRTPLASACFAPWHPARCVRGRDRMAPGFGRSRRAATSGSRPFFSIILPVFHLGFFPGTCQSSTTKPHPCNPDPPERARDFHRQAQRGRGTHRGVGFGKVGGAITGGISVARGIESGW